LSRDESIRALEDKLKNIHEDRIYQEKNLNDSIEDLEIKIDEKFREHNS